MKHSLLKRYVPLLIMLFVLMLTGCQRVEDARTDFCETLSDIGALATDFKNVKVGDPVDDLKAKVDSLQDKMAALDRLAELVPVPALEKLSTLSDDVAQSLDTASGETLGPAVDKINAAGAGLESIYLDLDDAICAGK